MLHAEKKQGLVNTRSSEFKTGIIARTYISVPV